MPPKTRSKNMAAADLDKPQPKKRGGQQSVLPMEHNNDIPSIEEPPVQQQPKKRSHQTAAIQGDAEDAPPAKRGKKVNDTAVADDLRSPEVTRPTRAKKPTAAAGKNAQDIPKRHRRTKEEVAADKKRIAATKEAKLQAAEDLIRRAEEAKAFLAQMNIEEERTGARMENEIPRRLSAVKRKRGGAQVEGSEGESFDEVSSSSEDKGSASEVEVVVKKVQKKKQKKGIREDVEIIATKLRGDNGGGRKKAESSLTDKAKGSLPKKYENAGLRVNSKPTGKARPAASREDDIEPSLGGLNDEDAEAERPAMFPVKRAMTSRLEFPDNLKRDNTRRNELVGFDMDSANENDTRALKAKSKGKSKVAPEKTTITKAKAKQAEVKEDNVICRTTTKAPTMDNLLKDPRWTDAFLSSLAHALYISQKPFKHFKSKAPEFLQVVQEIFNLSYPEIELALRSNDELVKTAYQRIKVKRAKLASDILVDVTKFFQGPEYAHQPDRIKEYAWWAVRHDGPGYYAQPTPLTCKVPPKDERYIKPDGFLQTEALATTAKKYLHFAEKSVLKPAISAENPPKALYALMLVATERAFRAYLPNGIIKSKKALEEFSDDNFAHELKTFRGHVDNVSERRWQLILNDLDEEEDNDVGNGDLSLISEFRANIFIPSSLIKAS
ncbi:hypothetical protein GALMADRAFT_135578 [Galerina marginata CBS 339.88]|uniref:Uncharacterized protein n=1 Tax=Galerina marginata (strain CBS 339.88) TaxID=685588 RepID=A0A067TQK5_GALM3|nr:hypothetical protein GALMADRAFT_135578 [Galerina marginata CBS 339.88]